MTPIFDKENEKPKDANLKPEDSPIGNKKNGASYMFVHCSSDISGLGQNTVL